MKQHPFLYFTDEVIAKLYPQWKHTGVTLEQFQDDCKQAKWQLDTTSLSYNPIVPAVDTLSFFGDPIDKDMEYLYECYTLACTYEKIGCIIYYNADKKPYSGSDEKDPVAVCFYDC